MTAAAGTQSDNALISCLQKNVDDHHSIRCAVAQLYVNGVNPDFDRIAGQRNSRPVSLPTYPFQRRRFWGPAKPRAAHSDFHTAHPLLGGKLSLAGSENESRYESYIEPDSPAWLPDHEVTVSYTHLTLPTTPFV